MWKTVETNKNSPLEPFHPSMMKMDIHSYSPLVRELRAACVGSSPSKDYGSSDSRSQQLVAYGDKLVSGSVTHTLRLPPEIPLHYSTWTPVLLGHMHSELEKRREKRNSSR